MVHHTRNRVTVIIGEFMQLAFVRTAAEMQSLAEEWNNLLKNSASHVPFLRHEYLSTWWRTLGGGEWQAGELTIVTARSESGSLSAVAPLFFTKNRAGEPALMFLGSIEISDYLDIIADPLDLEQFVPTLLGFLKSPQAPAWTVLDLYNLPETSPTLPLLEKAALLCGSICMVEVLDHCPYILLPGSWEEYLAGIDKKQRHEIRRKLRRAENHPAPVRWYIVSDPRTLPAEIEAFFDLMAFDPDKKMFLTEPMREQMRATALAAFENGLLQLSFLEVDGEKAAGYFNFDYEQHIWVYNSGFNPNFRELSAGWVLLGRLLEWANENKRLGFDFMRGDEDYKYRFGAVDRRVMRATIRR